MMQKVGKIFLAIFYFNIAYNVNSNAQIEILIEAESFNNKGGWVVDQQFIHVMGSSYLLAHGYGKPVENAKTKVKLPDSGCYAIWVRTKDWVADHEATPGTFKISINGSELDSTFGVNEGWDWVSGGKINLSGDSITVALIDQTGFDGRCDAIFLTTDTTTIPSNTISVMTPWRRTLQGLPSEPPSGGDFDLVVVGGGIAGCATAIAAAREGLSVALIQDRPWLGGNASQEIRVHTLGMKGDLIVNEINTEHWRNGHDDSKIDDDIRHNVINNESNITQFLSNRAYAVNKSNDSTITSIDIKHIATNAEQRITGDLFVDATGDGWIGYWAGASYMIGVEDESEYNESLAAENLSGKDYNLRNMMGCSMLWNAKEKSEIQTFPDVPWATVVSKDFESRYNYSEWFWEYGIGLNSIDDAEHIRDHLLRANYGTFSNIHAKNQYLYIDWMGYLIGKRESRRLVGDYILNQNDIDNAFPFPDGVVKEKRAIDIHYDRPNDEYDFLSEAHFHGIPEYTIPFRSFYSKDITNLMMAGRCFSATHVGLGSPRVMHTTGQMGVAVGYAASLCKKYSTLPRGVYKKHIEELRDILGYKESDFQYVTLKSYSIIVDNNDQHVEKVGEWKSSTYNKGYYGSNYMHNNNEGKGQKSFTYLPEIPEDQYYTLAIRYSSGENRADNVPISIQYGGKSITLEINQQKHGGNWLVLDTLYLTKDIDLKITIGTSGVNGYVIADAIALTPQIPFTTDNSYNLYDKKNIEVFPNPADSFIQISGLDIGTTVNMYNMIGKLLLSTNNPDRIDISHLRKGAYIINTGCGVNIKFLK